MNELVPHADVAAALKNLPDWRYENDGLIRQFTFEHFPAAMAFMASAVPEIDEMDHHPEWSNVYNRVSVRLTTHDSGGVTQQDFALARILDRLFSRPEGSGS